MYYVYLLKLLSKRTYIGCTNDLKDRIRRHKEGLVPITRNKRPVELIAYFAFTNKYTAFNFERYLKSGSGRAFIKRHNFV